MVAPLDLIEFDRLAPCDTTLLVQDLDRRSGYVKSVSSGATSGNTISTGGFKHFFSRDTWKMS
jgi:hypothetical protein